MYTTNTSTLAKLKFIKELKLCPIASVDVNDNTPQWKNPDIVGRQSSGASGPSGHHVVQPPQGGERGHEKAGDEGDRRGTSSSPSYMSMFGVNVATDTPLGTTLLHLDAIDLDDGALAL